MENSNIQTKKNSDSKLIKILKKYVGTVFALISASVLVYFCICDNNLINLINIIPQLNILWIIIAFCSLCLYWISESLIVKEITNLIYHKKYPKLFFLKVIIIGQYFNSITPLGIAGQPMQILELCKNSIPKSDAILITTRKFFVYQSCLTVYSIICDILYYETIKINCPEIIWMMWVGSVCQCFFIFLILIFSINKNIILKTSEFIINILYKLKLIKNKNIVIQSIENNLTSFIENNRFLSKNRKTNIKIYLLTFLQITFLFMIPFFVFKSFNHDSFPIIQIICAQSTINTISSFNPFPGAAGTTEKSFITLFSVFFTIQEIGKAMLLSRFISCYFTILIGTICSKLIFKNNKN